MAQLSVLPPYLSYSIIHFSIKLEFWLQKLSDTNVENNYKHLSSITLLLTKDRINLTYLRILLYRLNMVSIKTECFYKITNNL